MISGERSDESVVSYVLMIRERMETMMDMVKENLETAQKLQKMWYDTTARERSFEEQELVLALLLTSTNKLMAQWQGPYRVVKKVGKVNYQIDMHDRHKRKRIFHVNMLRKWHVRPQESSVMYAEAEDNEFEDLVSGWNRVNQLGIGLSLICQHNFRNNRYRKHFGIFLE